MFNWFRKNKSPEQCVEELVNRYFASSDNMSKEDFQKLKNCLEEWENEENPEYLGAMAYVRYREGDINKMWDYIEKDLHLDLGEEEHGAFIPAMMNDVDVETRYKILQKIDEHLQSPIAKKAMEELKKGGQ